MVNGIRLLGCPTMTCSHEQQPSYSRHVSRFYVNRHDQSVAYAAADWDRVLYQYGHTAIVCCKQGVRLCTSQNSDFDSRMAQARPANNKFTVNGSPDTCAHASRLVIRCL